MFKIPKRFIGSLVFLALLLAVCSALSINPALSAGGGNCGDASRTCINGAIPGPLTYSSLNKRYEWVCAKGLVKNVCYVATAPSPVIKPPATSGTSGTTGAVGTSSGFIKTGGGLFSSNPYFSDAVRATVIIPCPQCAKPTPVGLLNGENVGFGGASPCQSGSPYDFTLGKAKCQVCWGCRDSFGNSDGPCCQAAVSEVECGPTCYTCKDGESSIRELEPGSGNYQCRWSCAGECGNRTANCCLNVSKDDPAGVRYQVCGPGSSGGGIVGKYYRFTRIFPPK